MAKSSKPAAAAAAVAEVEIMSEPVPPRALTPGKLDEFAQILYAALTAHHQNQYPRTNTLGETIDGWAQLTENQKEGYRVAAAAVLQEVPPGEIEIPEEELLPPRPIARATAEELAQALYSGLSAAHGYRYPQNNRLGDPFEPYAQLGEPIKNGYRNAAFAVLSVPPKVLL